MHSIGFEDADMEEFITNYIQENNLEYGDEITLPNAPRYINVEIHASIDGKQITDNRQQQLNFLQKHSLCPDAIVIPIYKQKEGKTFDMKFDTGDLFTPISQVQVRYKIPVELDFAITVHKVQGRTMKKVVLALSDHPTAKARMNYAGVFVGVSRGRTRHDIRRLVNHHVDANGIESDDGFQQAYEYLKHLEPSPHVGAFYAGYERDNGPWNEAKCLDSYF